MAKVTNIVLTQLYPKVEKSMKSNITQWKKLMSNFFQTRSAALYDIAPIDRIYFNQEDENNFFNVLKISKQDNRIYKMVDPLIYNDIFNYYQQKLINLEKSIREGDE